MIQWSNDRLLREVKVFRIIFINIYTLKKEDFIRPQRQEVSGLARLVWHTSRERNINLMAYTPQRTEYSFPDPICSLISKDPDTLAPDPVPKTTTISPDLICRDFILKNFQNWLFGNIDTCDPWRQCYVFKDVKWVTWALARDFNTDLLLDQQEMFVTEHQEELGTAIRDAEMAVESSKANVAWIKQHYQTILDWLSHQ